MKKCKNKKTVKSVVEIKTGSVEEFFSNVESVMRAADKGLPIKKRCTSLSFVDPTEMLHFLSATKIKLINRIRNHPDSVTNIAKAMGRNRAAVYRDIHEMEVFGLVKIHEEINPRHGHHKIVELTAASFKLEAYI